METTPETPQQEGHYVNVFVCITNMVDTKCIISATTFLEKLSCTSTFAVVIETRRGRATERDA